MGEDPKAEEEQRVKQADAQRANAKK